MGCPSGCGEGLRGSVGDSLRNQGISCLSRLQTYNSSQFRRYLVSIIQRQPIQDVVDFLHAFLGFCVEPTPLGIIHKYDKVYFEIVQYLNQLIMNDECFCYRLR